MTAEPAFTAAARRLGVTCAVATAGLIAVYAAVLVAGLLSLPTPRHPITDPWFWILEILILLLMPCMTALMVVIHAWAPRESKAFSLTALVFMGMVCGLTCSIHFLILTVGRDSAYADLPWMPLFLSFTWPSIAYALDILAWDVFFPLAVLFAATVFSGSRLASSVRVLLVVSGVLALAGLSGVVAGDMQLRNIGIAGYVGVFPIAAVLLAILFHRSAPHGTD